MQFLRVGVFLFVRIIMDNKQKLIELGYCARPHGIKGGFSLVLYNQEDSILEDGLELVLVPSSDQSSISKNGENYEIEKVQISNKSIIYFKGITDRNVVEKMLPFKIFFDREKFPETDEGEFYLSDLIGLEAFNESGKRVGEITSLYDNGAQTIVVIETKNKDIIELPLVDNFFPVIDIENKKIIVRPPEFI